MNGHARPTRGRRSNDRRQPVVWPPFRGRGRPRPRFCVTRSSKMQSPRAPGHQRLPRDAGKRGMPLRKKSKKYTQN